MSEEKNVISDRPEKLKAAQIIKNEQKTQFAGKDGKGSAIDGFPFIPVGNAIFLEWNLPGDGETRIIGVDYSDRKPVSSTWTIIGVGGNVQTVDINDRVILKPESNISSFDTRIKKHEMYDLPDVRYHIIYEFDIQAIVK